MRISDWSSDVCSSDLAMRIRSGGSSSVLRGPAIGGQESISLYADSASATPAHLAADMSYGSQAAAANESMTAVRFDFPRPMDVPAGHSLTVPFIDGTFLAERVSVYQPDELGRAHV